MLSDEFDVFILWPSNMHNLCGLSSLFLPYFREIDSLADFDEAKYLASVLKRIHEPGRWLLFAQSKTGKPSGFSFFKIDRDERIGWGYIMEFYVRPEYRRQGLGRKLNEESCRLLSNSGVQKVWLTTCIPAESFWENCGFQFTGEVHENGKRTMAKIL
jgi:GNAT superfamily N-acetyltransferase